MKTKITHTTVDLPTTNDKINQARGEAHPGDQRRMLGSTPSSRAAHFLEFDDPPTDSEDESGHTTTLDELLIDYWDFDGPGDAADFP